MKKIQHSNTIFFLAATIFFFLSFYRNQWGIVPPGKFKNFQTDDQSLILARLAETRKSGIFSYAGLLGRGDEELYNINIAGVDPNYEEWYVHQYDTYLRGTTFSTYYTYGSQSGIQGMFFGILDQASPLTPRENLRIYRIITSLSFAITISAILLWFLIEFGWLTASFTFITTLFSPWLTLFGRSLFYFPTFFFIPFAATTYYLHRHSKDIEQVKLKFSIVVFISILLKCLFNGFDFILPSILAIIAPFIYFSIRDNWGARKLIHVGAIITISSAMAILVSLLILAIQISLVPRDFPYGIAYILDTFNRRTLGDPAQFPDYAASLQANVWDVVKVYLQGNTAISKTNLRFLDLIYIFGFFTGIHFLTERLQKETPSNSRKAQALILATWASILSPLLWYMIFKGQAYVHTHTNFLAWYMPFTIYGFGLCGYILQNLITTLKQKNN